jgi:hypothetical protein
MLKSDRMSCVYKKSYISPSIVIELDLEVRAGVSEPGGGSPGLESFLATPVPPANPFIAPFQVTPVPNNLAPSDSDTLPSGR